MRGRGLIAIRVVLSLAGPALLSADAAIGDVETYWPQWRGPLGTGEAPHANPPLEWSEEKNVRWKVAIPGRGHASPIVWGDRVFLLSAVPTRAGAGQPPPAEPGSRRWAVLPDGPVRFVVLALDRDSGKVVWERTAIEVVPHEGTHASATWASASAVTDGESIFAHFGSRGLFAYDWDGNVRWQADLGDMTTRNGFGEGSSPVLSGDTLVVNWDHEGDSFVVALDKRTGEERWRVERAEVTSWSTPVVAEEGGRTQVIVSATGAIRGYDLASGAVVWEAEGMTTNTIPTPIYRDGVLFATSGFRGNAFQAIRLSGTRGSLTGTDAVLWEYDRDTPYVPSPLLYGGALYFLKSTNGILSSLDAGSGELRHGPTRLWSTDPGVYASPVGAAGRVYIANRGGSTMVISTGEEYEVLAENQLDEGFDASPAIAGDELFLRGRTYLYCIAEDR